MNHTFNFPLPKKIMSFEKTESFSSALMTEECFAARVIVTTSA